MIIKLVTTAPLLAFSGIVNEEKMTSVGASGTSKTKTSKELIVDILGTPSSVHFTYSV